MHDIKRYRPDVIAIRADPEIIDDLYYILEKLLTLSRRFRSRLRTIQAEMKAQCSERAAEQRARFDKLSMSVYREYMKAQAEGLTRGESIKRLVRALGLQYYEAELYVSNGRRVEKDKRDRSIQAEAQAGKDMAEIAALYGLSARTVKRILEKK